MLNSFLRQKESLNLNVIAQETEGYLPADLRQLVQRAYSVACTQQTIYGKKNSDPVVSFT
jgi:hypothetical protein